MQSEKRQRSSRSSPLPSFQICFRRSSAVHSFGVITDTRDFDKPRWRERKSFFSGPRKMNPLGASQHDSSLRPLLNSGFLQRTPFLRPLILLSRNSVIDPSAPLDSFYSTQGDCFNLAPYKAAKLQKTRSCLHHHMPRQEASTNNICP